LKNERKIGEEGKREAKEENESMSKKGGGKKGRNTVVRNELKLIKKVSRKVRHPTFSSK